MTRPTITRTEDWTYKVEGFAEPFPSVTNIIKATVPKELAWWGMTVGTHGVAELRRQGKLMGGLWTGEYLTAMLSQHKLTVNHRLTSAGDRGMAIHKMMENYGKTGELTPLAEFTETQMGYAKGLAKWLMDTRPYFHQQEVMTASPTYGYAGTFDGRCTFQAGKYINKTALIDLKTSKAIYRDQHFPQIEAYEQAEVELGELPTDLRLVVLVTEDGKYKQGISNYDFTDFEVLLNHYNQIQRRKRKRA